MEPQATQPAPLGIAPSGIPNANPSNPNQNNPFFNGLGQNAGASNGFRISYGSTPSTLPISSGSASAQTRASELTQGQTVTDLNGNTGIVNFDPNTGSKLAPGQTVNTPVPSTVPAPAVISSKSLVPTAPISLPPATTDTSSAGVIGAVDASTQALKDADTAAAEKTQDSGDAYLDAVKQIGDLNGQGKLDIENANNVSGLKSQLDDIGTQIATEKQNAQDQITAAQNANIGGGSAASVQAQIGRIQSQSASRLADLGILQNSINNKYSTASSIADAQLQAKLAPLQAALQAQQFMYTNNKDLQTQAHTDFINQQTRNYNQIQQDLTDVKNVKLEVAKSGNAPVSVLNQLSNATNLTQALSIAGQYLSDPVAKALAQANLEHVQLENKNLRVAASSTGATNVSQTNPITGTTLNVPTSVAPYQNYSNNGQPYADLSKVQGTAAEKTNIINQAEAAGIKPILNANTALDLANIKDASAKLDTIQQAMNIITNKNAVSRDTYGAALSTVENYLQTDPQKVAAGVFPDASIDILKAMSGVQGFRGGASIVSTVSNTFPKITDTQPVANAKIQAMRNLINDRETSLVGSPKAVAQPVVPKAATQGNNEYVNQVLNAQGRNYNDFISQVPEGKIPLIDNATGTIGYANKGDTIDSNKFTRI